MKKIFFLTAILAALTLSSYGQAKPANFSGTWNLDIPKSQMNERMRIESLTMTVVQSDKELKVTSETKRPGPPADASQPGPNGPGGGRRGMRGFGSDGTVAYSLDGKETIVEIDGPNGKMPIKYTASLEAGKANLTSSRSFSGPMGDITATTKEVWTLSPDGKILTVARTQTTPRGESTSTLVFVKK